MKSKKVTMLAAALVVAVVALAGVGYAATTYKATTVNEHNSIDSTYMTLTQDGQAAYTNNFFTGIYYDTLNTASGVIKYTPVCGYKIDTTQNKVVADADGDLAKVSKDLMLNIDTQKSTTTPISLKVTVTDFTPVTNLTYTMILLKADGTIVAAEDYSNGWTFDTVPVTASSATNNFTIALYISSTNGVSGTLPANFDSAGFTNYDGTANPVVDGSVFTFVATATVN